VGNETDAESNEEDFPKPRIWRPDSLTVLVDLPRADDKPGVVTHPVAGPGLRLTAEALDLFFATTLVMLVTLFLGNPLAVESATTTTATASTAASSRTIEETARQLQPWILAIGAVWLGLPILLATLGLSRTPGMALLNLAQINVHTGEKASLFALLLRALIRPLEALPLFFLSALYLSTRDPLGANRFPSDQYSHTILIRQQPLRTELEKLGVPATVYGTSETGYLVEAVVARLPNLSPERAHNLARRVAQLVMREHPEVVTPELQHHLDRNQPVEFLRALMRTR
jgi:uncharacterized RDD family membrane protein YckC